MAKHRMGEGANVFNIFQPHRDPDQPLADARRLLLLRAQPPMGGGRWVGDGGLGVPQVGGNGEHAGGVDQAPGRLDTFFDTGLDQAIQLIQPVGQEQGQGRKIAMTAPVGQAVQDVRRTIDLLASRPEVDPKKIGITGISLGGIVSGTAAGMEPRINRAMLILAGGDLLTTLHEAEETRDQAITYLQQREAELTNQLTQTEAELRAAMDGLRDARHDAEQLRAHVERMRDV